MLDLPALVIVAKYVLLVVVAVCLLRPALLGPLGWGYYAAVLVVISVGQNIAVTDGYGTVWLVGNTAIQLGVAGLRCC